MVTKAVMYSRECYKFFRPTYNVLRTCNITKDSPGVYSALVALTVFSTLLTGSLP